MIPSEKEAVNEIINGEETGCRDNPDDRRQNGKQGHLLPESGSDNGRGLFIATVENRQPVGLCVGKSSGARCYQGGDSDCVLHMPTDDARTGDCLREIHVTDIRDCSDKPSRGWQEMTQDDVLVIQMFCVWLLMVLAVLMVAHEISNGR